jgi:hypothetical protein
MNMFTSQQRKLVYLCGILILLIPIIYLGLPSDGVAGSGGELSRLRSRYELGESDLGKVDPSGAAMNLVLLGMRGVAVNLLFTEFEKQKDAKQWFEMQNTTESIVRLQPHFERVWEMNGWNLAYNTSAEWDGVEDRYYWVKMGGLFLKRGVEQNRKSTHLQYHVANIYQKKIGIADEAKFYRKFFLNDPDPKFKGGHDPAFNPDIEDNYLVAKKQFLRACQIEDTEHRPQHILDRTLFRSMPARCQFDYAAVLQKDGKFGEETREAWQEALSDWNTKFGNEIFSVPVGDLATAVNFDIRLEMTRDDIKREVPNPDDGVRVAKVVDQYRKMVNYYYWTTRGNCESERTTSEAHRNLYEGSQKYKNQEWEDAKELVFAGMTGFDDILRRPEYAELKNEDSLVEECLLGIRVWKDIHELGQMKIPTDYPLKWLELEHQGNQQIQQNVQRAFKRQFLTD